MQEAIKIDNLIVEYGKKRALDDLSLSVRQGEIFGFLGPNGAGKTTAIKALLGLVFPVQGSVRIHGMPANECRAKEKLGYVPEETTYYHFLTPVEILSFYGGLFDIPKEILKVKIDKLLRLVGLDPVARRPLSTFSKGMAQKLGLAQALINDPDTLIMDEPTSGLDPLARMELRSVLESLKNRGKTIFFSSHELSEVELICDSVTIIGAGKTVRSGNLQEILKSSGESSLEKLFLSTVQGAVS